MSAHQLFGLSVAPLARGLRRWWIRRRLAAINYHLTYIRGARANDFEVERMLHAEEALLQSELRGF